MEINVFTYGYVADLLRNVKVKMDFSPYYSKCFPHEENYPKGRSGIIIPDDFKLINSENGKHFDLENSIALYEKISGVSPAVASDERLWTYLTHVLFWEYMKSRWPIDNTGKKDDIKGRIINRYFLKGSNLETLSRNGISRLWWYAHLTVDESRSDKYELTRVLLERADIAVGLLERAFGANDSIRKSFLKFLQKNDDIRKSEAKTRSLLKLINLAGGVRNLPGLNEDDLLVLFGKIKKEIM